MPRHIFPRTCLLLALRKALIGRSESVVLRMVLGKRLKVGVAKMGRNLRSSRTKGRRMMRLDEDDDYDDEHDRVSRKGGISGFRIGVYIPRPTPWHTFAQRTACSACPAARIPVATPDHRRE